MNWNEIAAEAYEVYAQIIDHMVGSLPVPEWNDLPPRIQEAWREAVKTACERAASAVAT